MRLLSVDAKFVYIGVMCISQTVYRMTFTFVLSICIGGEKASFILGRLVFNVKNRFRYFVNTVLM